MELITKTITVRGNKEEDMSDKLYKNYPEVVSIESKGKVSNNFGVGGNKYYQLFLCKIKKKQIKIKIKKHKGAKYYFYSNPNQGERYFRVEGEKEVLQIVTKVTEKKGRTYCIGISYIKYSTFIGSWGWKINESRNIREIHQSSFDRELEKMIKKFR